MTLEKLLEYGHMLVAEQENVKRVQLADKYLSKQPGSSGPGMTSWRREDLCFSNHPRAEPGFRSGEQCTKKSRTDSYVIMDYLRRCQFGAWPR
ncbi:hypothetical protein SETIT_8G250600v2 [Setaria italica]|uniref:Uncharacterized protein n=1 Tax=Setaria italica TaxID=4555 RepID=A0A368SBQ6_SETIT|nr:hypothetical protein SETIT_8G250600v2 [Setaria italica]